MQGPMQLACSSLSALERLVRRRRRSLEEVDCLKRSFQGLGPKPLQLMRAQDELVVQGARGVRAARPAMCHAATPRMPGCRAAKKPACGHVLLQLHGNCERGWPPRTTTLRSAIVEMMATARAVAAPDAGGHARRAIIAAAAAPRPRRVGDQHRHGQDGAAHGGQRVFEPHAAAKRRRPLCCASRRPCCRRSPCHIALRRRPCPPRH